MTDPEDTGEGSDEARASGRRRRPTHDRARHKPGPASAAVVLDRAGIERAFPGRQHTLTGDVRLHRHVPSRILGRSRDVLVYLPPGYDAEAPRRYPVLYFNDGQNLFDGATSYVPGQEWQLDETAERLMTAGEIAPLIIVGLYHAVERRLDEFAPSRDPKRRAGGAASLYGRMIAEELKPLIDATYRTLPGAANTGLGGSSMGGLAALYLGLTMPGVFGRLAVMSPSVWWDGRMILETVKSLRWRPHVRVWLDVGTAEGKVALTNVRALRRALVTRGWQEGVDLSYVEDEGAGHSEAAWAARVAPMLRFLFP